MKRHLKVLSIAFLLILPASIVRADLSEALQGVVAQVVKGDEGQQAALVSALVNEVKAAGQEALSSITADVISQATSKENAAQLAQALVDAVDTLAENPDFDLATLLNELRNGVEASKSKYSALALEVVLSHAPAGPDEFSAGGSSLPTLSPLGDPAMDVPPVSTGTGIGR